MLVRPFVSHAWRAYYVPEALYTVDIDSQLSLKEVRNTIDHTVWWKQAKGGRG